MAYFKLYRPTKQIQRHPHREITKREAVLRISHERGGYDGDAVDVGERYVFVSVSRFFFILFFTLYLPFISNRSGHSVFRLYSFTPVLSNRLFRFAELN